MSGAAVLHDNFSPLQSEVLPRLSPESSAHALHNGLQTTQFDNVGFLLSFDKHKGVFGNHKVVDASFHLLSFGWWGHFVAVLSFYSPWVVNSFYLLLEGASCVCATHLVVHAVACCFFALPPSLATLHKQTNII